MKHAVGSPAMVRGAFFEVSTVVVALEVNVAVDTKTFAVSSFAFAFIAHIATATHEFGSGQCGMRGEDGVG